jgi:hypothetical protein
MRSAFSALVVTLVFCVLIDYVTRVAPEFAGRAAFACVIAVVCMFGYSIHYRLKKVREDIAVLDHKLNRINTTVVDIQQNPLVEFKVDPTTHPRRRGGG